MAMTFILLCFPMTPLWVRRLLRCMSIAEIYMILFSYDHRSINQFLFSIQTNNDNIQTFANMNTERAGKEVILLMLVSSKIKWLV